MPARGITFSFREIGWEDVLKYVVGVVALANFCRFLAYAAAVSYAAWRELEGVKPREIADNAYHITGALGVLGAFLLLTIQG